MPADRPAVQTQLTGDLTSRPTLLIQGHYRLLNMHFELIHPPQYPPIGDLQRKADFQPSKWLLLKCRLLAGFECLLTAMFWQLWWACPAGALGAVIQEAGEGGGEIRQLVAFGALGAEADVVRHNPARAKLAGEPIEFGRRSADCGGPRAIGQGAQRLQHLLGSHACGGYTHSVWKPSHRPKPMFMRVS